MPQVQAVRASLHSDYQWLPFTHYRFAEHHPYVAVTAQEFVRLAVMAPIVFVSLESGYRPVMLQAIEGKENLFVDREGKWLGRHVPASYRSHPFTMAKDEQGASLLSFHGDSEFVLTGPRPGLQSQRFFEGGGLSPALREVMNFLTTIEAQRKSTESLCELFADMELFKPWTFNIKMEEGMKSIGGFYSIDEGCLRSLSGEQLQRLMRQGGMGPIYCHLFSLQSVNNLAVRYQKRHAKEVKASQDSAVSMIDMANDEAVNLDWL